LDSNEGSVANREFGAATSALQRPSRKRQREGYRALSSAQSHTLRDHLESGRGRIEFVDLSHQYLQLTPLVGVA